MASRGSRNFALAALALLLVLAAVLGVRPRRAASAPAAAAATPEPAIAAAAAPALPLAQSMAPVPEPVENPADRLPPPPCWSGLLELDRAGSIDDFRRALEAGLGSGELAGDYATERLAQLIGADDRRALEVAALAEHAVPPDLGIYFEALKASEAVQHAEVRDRLFQLAESGKVALDNRQGALVALESQRHLEPASVRRLEKLALDRSLDSGAWVATRTLGRVMKEDFERGGDYRPYWEGLLQIAQQTGDTAVRLLALEMPSYSNPLLGKESIPQLARLMREDGSADVREMAAFRLGVTSESEKALDAFRDAFPAEQSLCVRWAMFRFAVRAAGAAALPLLQRFAALDPRLAQDAREFEQLYASGVVDFERVWLGKKENIQCLGEEPK